MRQRAPCDQAALSSAGNDPMARTYRLVGTFRTTAIAAFLAGAPTLASANHELYPPGWNTPSQPGPLLFQFVPGGSRYHVVKPATTQNSRQSL
jgi:hypothetical protein